MTGTQRSLPFFLFFYDVTLHWRASIQGWEVPGDGDIFFPDIYNLRLRHLSRRLYTQENLISTVQSEFIDSRLFVCVMCVCINIYVCMYSKKSRRVTCILRFIHAHKPFSKDFFFAIYFPLSFQMLKHFNSCTYSENQLFLQSITERLRNAFPNP